MIYITGDKHGDYIDVFNFCNKYKTSKNDILIILGDAGINYYLDERDYILKDSLKELPITLFCIHGNHEERPENIRSYKTKKIYDGIVYYEEDYPNILFAKDAEIYGLNGNSVLVIGGAYSVDKEYRLMMGYNWYQSEQPSEEIKNKVKKVLQEHNNKVDIILSHTCPFKYMPYEVFMSGVDQSKVDKSTEEFLDEIENITEYKKWYCGHYHTDKRVDKLRFMMNDIDEFKLSIDKKLNKTIFS